MLPGEFTESTARSGRYDWHGHGAAGVFINDNGHRLGSTHNTAPTGHNKTHSIFDFCRLHIHGHLDDSVGPDVGMTKRPSYKAMVAWIKEGHPEVVAEFKARQADERSTAEADFGGMDASDSCAAVDQRGRGMTTATAPQVEEPGADEHAVAPVGKAASLSATIKALQSPNVCGVRLAQDAFTGHILLSPASESPPAWSQLRDTDYTRLRVALERAGMKVSADEMARAVALAAEQMSFDAAIQWLQASRLGSGATGGDLSGEVHGRGRHALHPGGWAIPVVCACRARDCTRG